MASEWFIFLEGHEFGPMSSGELRQLAKQGRITKETKVRRGVDTKWVSADRVKGLFDESIASAPATRGDVRPPRVVAPAPPPPPAVPPPVSLSVEAPIGPSLTPQVALQVNVAQQSRSAHSFGISSLVVGVLGLFTCWLPIVGIPVSLLGLLLGIVGLVLGVARKGSGIGFSIAGTALCTLVLIPCVLFAVMMGNAISGISHALDEAGQRRKQEESTNQKTVEAPDGRDAALGTIPDSSGSNESPVDHSEWAQADTVVQQEDVRVSIISTIVGPVRLTSIGDESRSKDNLLTVRLRVENASATKKLQYRGWGADRLFSLSNDAPTLTDNHGNNYLMARFGFGTTVQGQVQAESIYPGKSIEDVIVFEQPVDKIEYLRLELPAAAFGGSGRLRFEIPVRLIKRPN